MCDAQQLPAVKPPVAATQQQLPKPTVQLPKSSSESLLKNLPQAAPGSVIRVTPRMVAPQSSMQSPMMGGLPQRMDERQFRTRIEPGTRDEIRERRSEQIKRHELCRRLEQRRQELLLERREREQKATK